MSKSNKDYYTAPSDLFQGLIRLKTNTLNNVLDWQIIARDFDVWRTEQQLGIKYGSKEDTQRNFEKLYKRKHKKTMFSISAKMFWDFYKHEKSEEELLLLLFYLASKSIVGHKEFILTNVKHIISRMAGYESYRDMMNTYTDFFHDEIFAKYVFNERKAQYKIKQLREKAAASFNYCSYSENGVRGFYFSCKGITDEEKDRLMREMRDAARKPTKRQRERERLRKIREEE